MTTGEKLPVLPGWRAYFSCLSHPGLLPDHDLSSSQRSLQCKRLGNRFPGPNLGQNLCANPELVIPQSSKEEGCRGRCSPG